MSPVNLVNLVVFLWLVSIYGVLSFLRGAHPYREGSPEQKREDEEQERALAELERKRKVRLKK